MNHQRHRILEMMMALSPDGMPGDLRLEVSKWARAEDPDHGWVVVPDLNHMDGTKVFRARLHTSFPCQQDDQGHFQIVVECSDSDSGDGFSEVGVWQAKIDWSLPVRHYSCMKSISFGEVVSENPGASHLWDCESHAHVKHDEDAIGRALMQWAVGQGRDSKVVKRMVEEARR